MIRLNDIAFRITANVERIWPTPEEDNQFHRQCMALSEETGEVCRASLKLSHARRSPKGMHKGKTPSDWEDELHTEIGQAIGCALQLAVLEGLDIEKLLIDTLQHLERMPCILDVQ